VLMIQLGAKPAPATTRVPERSLDRRRRDTAA
jgi:hypothetical protein